LSWVRVVPNIVGWIGFVITVLSVIISVIIRKYWRPPAA
jgi:hypothetical protein